MRTWEISFPIQDWLLDFFQLQRGLVILIEEHLNAYNPTQEDNAIFIEISFIWQIEIVLQHWIEQSVLMVTFLWPNQFYQEDPK